MSEYKIPSQVTSSQLSDMVTAYSVPGVTLRVKRFFVVTAEVEESMATLYTPQRHEKYVKSIRSRLGRYLRIGEVEEIVTKS